MPISPESLALRRKRVLAALSRFSVPVPVSRLMKILGWSAPTVRGHLAFLEGEKKVTRVNFRLWAVAKDAPIPEK